MPLFGASTLASLVLATAAPALPPQASPEGAPLDARFVRMEIPRKVLTDQVFQAKIVMKNTGSEAWREDRGRHTRLRSQDPQDNMTWGTNFIIQGQGSVVNPGDEWTFTSHLKAPGAPGEAVFRWRLAGARDGVFFGEATPREIVQVEKRPEAPPGLPARNRPGKRVLTFADFEYVGSFGVPREVQGAGAAWSESGLALRKPKDGPRRLFLNYTHPKQALFEVEVPEIVRLEEGKSASLKTAEVKKVWGPVAISIPRSGDTSALHPNGGFWWDEGKRTLYWTSYHGYRAGEMLPVLGASKLEEDGTVSSSGPWSIPEPASARYKSYWGGVTRLPREFADRHTGGRTLALGFGGYYSICAPCSRGPAIGAIAEPDPGRGAVDIVELLTYGNGAAAPRDGGYLNANCGFWHEQSEGPERGTWTYDDMVRSGVFIDLPQGHAFLAFARLATGRIGYDYGAIVSAGKAQWWYAYDPEDLGEAAGGARKPWDILPYARSKVAYPGNNAGAIACVTGACFDEETRQLFLYKPFALDFGPNDSRPCVHVYRLK